MRVCDCVLAENDFKEVDIADGALQQVGGLLLSSILCLNVCRLCVPNIITLGICFKILHNLKVGAFA